MKKNLNLHNLSSIQYTPNRKFARHRKRIIRVMTSGEREVFEASTRPTRVGSGDHR